MSNIIVKMEIQKQKYRLYVDEVGNSDLASSNDPNHRFLSLTGVIINLEYVRTDLHSQMEKFKNDFFGSHPDEPVNFHRKEILNAKPPFTKLKNKLIDKEFPEFGKKIIQILQNKYDSNGGEVYGKKLL